MYEKYKLLFSELKSCSLTVLAKRHKIDIQHLRKQFKRFFPDEYSRLIYGQVIAHYKDKPIYKIRSKQTDRCELLITKEAKVILKDIIPSLIDEVGVWYDNYKRRHVIDLWDINSYEGYELCFSVKDSKCLIKKMENYRRFCSVVYIVFLKDSSHRKYNKNYPILVDKISKAGGIPIVLDISNPPTSRERLISCGT